MNSFHSLLFGRPASLLGSTWPPVAADPSRFYAPHLEERRFLTERKLPPQKVAIPVPLNPTPERCSFRPVDAEVATVASTRDVATGWVVPPRRQRGHLLDVRLDKPDLTEPFVQSFRRYRGRDGSFSRLLTSCKELKVK